MTTFFVSSVTGDNSTGASWTTAKTSIAAGLALCSAGDTVLVDAAHAFTATAAITYTPPTGGGVAVISVTPTGTTGYTAFAAGAAESVGAASNAFIIAAATGSSMYLSGLTINGGTNNAAQCNVQLLPTSGSNGYLELISCTVNINSVNAGAQIILGDTATTKGKSIRARGCTFSMVAANTIALFLCQGGRFDIITPTFATPAASKPAQLFIFNGSGANLIVRDGDASGYAVTSSAYLSVTANQKETIIFDNLKLSATPALTTGTWPAGSTGSITLRNTDSGNTLTVRTFIAPTGTLTVDTAKYVTAAPAFNGAGASWKIVTNATATEFNPFVTPPLMMWGTSTAGQTAAVEIIQDSAATALTNRQAWFEIETAASASFPNYTFTTDRNTEPFVGTAADQPTSTTAWTGSFTTPTKQQLQNSVTPAAVGLILGRVKVGTGGVVTLWMQPQMSGLT